MNRKKKGSAVVTMIVFAFMTSPHQMLAVTETGKKVLKQEFDSVQAAKDELMTPGFLQIARHATGGVEPEIIWIDDPASDQRVMDACDKMEAIGRGEVVEQQETTSEENQENYSEENSSENSEGDSENSEEPAGETIEETPDSAQQEIKEVVEQVISEESKDLPQIEVPAKIPEVPTEETLEVETIETTSERKLKEMVIHLETLKNELLAINADYNKQIKDQLKAIFAYSHGKSLTHVKCRIVYDWETGIREYFREDTGELVKTLAIPDEMRQIRMGLDVPEKVQAVQGTAEAAQEIATPENSEAAQGDIEGAQETSEEQSSETIQESLNGLNQAISENAEENPFENNSDGQDVDNGTEEQSGENSSSDDLQESSESFQTC